MPRPKNRCCRVCGQPCTGHVCKDCFHTKSNKGRYKTPLQYIVKTQLDVIHREDIIVDSSGKLLESTTSKHKVLRF